MRSGRKPIPGDALGRANVFALKRGKGRKTVLLAGHFDTVPADDYGALKPLAFDPERLLEKIDRALARDRRACAGSQRSRIGRLSSRPRIARHEGRRSRRGSRCSKRMRATAICCWSRRPMKKIAPPACALRAPQIAALAKEQGLDIALAINLDSIADDGDGSFGRSIAFGSIGKLLLTAFVVGREAHACYPFQGINANYLAGALLTAFECAPELAELTGNEIAAPPTALQAKDLKSGYNVTTPAQVWLYWNTLQHKRSATEVLEIAMRLARETVTSAVAQLNHPRAEPQAAGICRRCACPHLCRTGGRTRLDALVATDLAGGDLDLPTRSLKAHPGSLAAFGPLGPAVVIGFGSIPYQAVTLGDDALRRRLIAAAGRDANPIDYFPGISDMSFLGRGNGGFEIAAANTPIWGTSFTLDPSPGYPIVNIGPWGRDYHHWLERLNTPFAFKVLPG